jgi:Mg-chelatase subunit ChlI
MATPKPSTGLSLTRTEVTFCKNRAEESGLTGQRAMALLAIHQGETQAKAVEISGLTLGQVRYIIGRFRLHRTEALQTDLRSPAENTISTDVKAKSTAKNKKAKAKSKDKDKKGKKDKNKDKKKAKSDKKNKKDKKSKKKKSKK